MEDLWNVLDLEFSQEQEVINATDDKLGKLLQQDCPVEEHIVQLRNHLPNLESALNAVEGLDNLQSPDRVNILVYKFDERTLHDLDCFRCKSRGSTYDCFFNFLVDSHDACRSPVARAKSISQISSHCIKRTTSSKCHRCLNSGPEW